MDMFRVIIISLTLGINGAYASTSSDFERSFKKGVLKKLTERNMTQGRLLAEGSCQDGIDLLTSELAELGGERGFNSALDSIGVLLAATKVSDKKAWNQLVWVISHYDDPQEHIEKFFSIDEHTEAACDSYTSFGQMVQYIKV